MMNRLRISIVLLVVIIIMATATTIDVHFTVVDLRTQLEVLRETSDREQAVAFTEVLSESWNRYEDRLVLYVNHNTLDTLTLLLAEVPALVEYEETAFLHSKIDAILELLDDLWKSTIPNYRNLL